MKSNDTSKKQWTLDLKGHYVSDENTDLPVGRHQRDEQIKEIVDRHLAMAAIFAEHDDGSEFAEKVGESDLINVKPSCLHRCGKCGGEVGFTANPAKRHAVAQSECPAPEGLGEYEVSFDIPSGKIVFANDLREFYPVPGHYDVNYETGCKRTSEAYAALGMFHFFVGNTCPGVYQQGNRLNIGGACNIADEDGEEDGAAWDDLYDENDHGKRVGAICTDLWWYSAADYDDLKQRMEAAGKDFAKFINGPHVDVVDVEPGHYRAVGRNHLVHKEQSRVDLAHSDVWRLQRALDPEYRKEAAKEIEKSYYHSYLGIVELAQLPVEDLQERLRQAEATLRREKEAAPKFELRSYIERVGDCTGINTHAKAEAANQAVPSLEDYIKLSRLAYPRLYPNRARVLDHIFLTIGNGLDWHDGALYSTCERYEAARRRLAAGEEVTFDNNDARQSYYPMSEDYSGVFTVPDDVRHDWLAGAFETLKLVMRSDPSGKFGGGHTNADNIDKAKKAYNELHERFRDRPEYQPVFAWLQSRKTYPEIVESFVKQGWKPADR